MKKIVALAALCTLAYAPCLNNGFISDDYVNLRYAETIKSDFWSLFQSPPLNFRLTSFVAYSILQTVFGHRYEFFYAANILLHFVNCLLLWKLLRVLGRDENESYLAAVLFAVFQAPQEAVMWIAAMNETLLGLFVLTTLLLWFKGRYLASATVFLLALFSKESAPIVLPAIPFIRWQRGEKPFTREMTVLLAPMCIFAAAFFWTWSGNSMIQHRVYEIGPRAFFVLARSLHLLFRPSFYVLLIALFASMRPRKILERVPTYVLWVAIALLPYMFLTYAPYIPSRQLYMASMVLVSVMACLLFNGMQPRLRQVLVIAFVAYNAGYMWLHNDEQYENRAAPTTQLLSILKSNVPAPILLDRFPYPVPDVAKDVTRFAPGWQRELIHVNEQPESCRECVILRWDPELKKFVGQ